MIVTDVAVAITAAASLAKTELTGSLRIISQTFFFIMLHKQRLNLNDIYFYLEFNQYI